MNARHSIRVVALGFFAVTLSGSASAQEDTYEDTDPTALVDFHATLDPVGNWVDDPTYGTVWVPKAEVVGPNFVPYATAGHWTYGDDYTWVSDYDWGWAPFHYGRWIYADGHGWSWIPGREYAPAWVNWRIGKPGFGFVGWAPAPPRFLWRGGAAVNVTFGIPARFLYCESGDIFHPRIFDRIVRGPRVDGIAIRMRPFDEHPWGGGRRFFGPVPARLGIEPGRIVHFTGREPGLAHARDFAHPSLAVRYGAHPPMHAGSFERAGERPGEHGIEHGAERHEARSDERPHGDSPGGPHGSETRRPAGADRAHAAMQAHGAGHGAPSKHGGR